MRKRTSAVLALIPVAALCAGAGLVQPEREGARLGRGAGQPEFDPSQFVERMFERDADGDGKLSREELGEGPGARMFENADANADGYLERSEVETFAAQRRAGRPGFTRPNAGQPGEPGVASPETPSLHDSMEQAGRALRRLRRSAFTAESRAADLEGLAALQQALLHAKAQSMTAEVAPQAKAKFGADEDARAAMRTHLARVLHAAIEAELAVLENQPEKATAAVVRLQELRDESHEIFEPREDAGG